MRKYCLFFLQRVSVHWGRTSGRPLLQGGCIAGSLLALLLWLFQPVQAQLPATDQILFLDHFPEIRVRVLCNDPTIVDPAAAFRLSEDGTPQTILSATATLERPRTQTAIFLDLFAGQKKFAKEVGDTLDNLYDLYVTNTFTVATDDLAVYAPATDARSNRAAKLGATDGLTTPLDVIVDWTGNAGLIVNSVYTVTFGATEHPFNGFKATPLLDLLLETLTRFDRNSLRRQSLIVFSDGTEPEKSSKAQVANVTAAARAQGITIHTFWIDTGFDGRKNLQELAEETGGQFAVLSEKPGAEQAWWQQFWQQLIVPSRICDLTYRTSNPHPQLLLVYPPMTATLATHPMALPLLTAPAKSPMLQVQLLRQDSQRFVQPALTSSMTTAIPIDLLLAWNFAGDPPRRIQSIQYTIKGAQTTIQGKIDPPPAPTQEVQLSIPLTAAQPGVHAIYDLKVELVDELGLNAQESVPFGVLAPTATPTPIPTPTNTPPPTPLPTATPVPSPTPTATFTWIQGAVATAVTGVNRGRSAVDQGRVTTQNWFAADSPYRALLVSSILLFVGLAILVYWLWQKRLQQLREELEIIPETTPAKIYGILYRLQDHPELTLQQVVKLEEKEIDLPEKLYTSETAAQEAKQAKGERLSIFNLLIARRDKRYRLEQRRSSREILVQRGNETITVNRDLTLLDNDRIKLGQTNYAFYELDESLPASTASSTSLVAPPPTGATDGNPEQP